MLGSGGIGRRVGVKLGDQPVDRERDGPGEHLEEDAAERVDIAGDRRRAAVDELRRQVVDGADQPTDLCGLVAAVGPGQAEVRQKRLLPFEQDVGRLDVTVDEALDMRGIEPGGELAE